jgi:hypothetical protein
MISGLVHLPPPLGDDISRCRLARRLFCCPLDRCYSYAVLHRTLHGRDASTGNRTPDSRDLHSFLLPMLCTTTSDSSVVYLGLGFGGLVKRICAGPSCVGETTAGRWWIKQEIYCTQDVHSVTTGWRLKSLAMADFRLHRVPSSGTKLCGRSESDLVTPLVQYTYRSVGALTSGTFHWFQLLQHHKKLREHSIVSPSGPCFIPGLQPIFTKFMRQKGSQLSLPFKFKTRLFSGVDMGERPITVAAPSKAWTVFVSSNAGIVVSNPTQCMDVCVRLFCVCVVLRVGSGFATGWSPVQGVLATVYGIKKLKKRPRSNKGL